MKKFYCYSKCLFDQLMENSGFFAPEDLPNNVAIISIGAPWNEHEDHWFKTTNENILNIDFDDVSPEIWWCRMNTGSIDLYDIAQYNDNQDYYFTCEYKGSVIKALNYPQAREIVKFIEDHKHFNFFIHCSAGISRSQGVVRYVMDTYGDFETNPDNPCVCPNVHVTRMLKRAYKEKYNSVFYR